MAFVANNNQQLSLMDSTFNLTEREKRVLEKSWAKAFAEYVFPAIDETIFSELYSSKASRPNTPVNVIVGALILKEALGDTDDELVEALMFDVRYQYALHTTSFEEQPLSDRTLSRFRARVLAYETEHDVDLIHECTVKMAKELSEFMKITPNMQRMDSLMIAANIRNLSLLELFYTCVANLAKIMNQREKEIPEKQHHYIEKDDYNRCIYHKRDMDAAERTIAVMHDAEVLIQLCDNTGDFDDTSEYQLLIRLLKERTIIDDDGSRRLLEKKEIKNTSEVLLNPSDPEATFRYKAGGKNLGYVGNVVESVGETGSLITDYSYEKNVYADNQFMKDYLHNQQTFEEEAFIVADGAYSGEENSRLAKDHNLKLVTTNFTGRKPDEIYAEFKFTQDGQYLIECINKCAPEECIYDPSKDRSVAYFKIETCNSCPYKEKCLPRFLKTRVRKEVSWKSVGRAKQLQYMKTEEFSQYARFRNGVEAIPSLLRRRYHVDKIPTHGKYRTRFHFGFKIAALNFQKLLNYTNSLANCDPKLKVV
jgi:hypothetical protein